MLSLFVAAGCTSELPVDASGTDGDMGASMSTSSSSGPGETTNDTQTNDTQTADTQTADTDTTGEVAASTGLGSSSTGGPATACGQENCQVDVLFVVDNSGTMGMEQRFVGRAMPAFESGLRDLGMDVQVMFTTTDIGNSQCTAFQPAGYLPADGAPISTPCTTRLQDFDGLGTTPDSIPEACTDVCPTGVAPGDPFVAFGGEGHNVPGVPGRDVDGDGTVDGPVSQALACLAPMGINGCGYESPLESMMQAIDPAAEWNLGERPFLRDGATLAIVLLTDEYDCSVRDHAVMEDTAFFEQDPGSGMLEASSALCWNAGVECEGPDADGTYHDCTAAEDTPLQPVSRYVSYLIETLRETEDKDVVMLGVLGVPVVTEHASESPFLPTQGGVEDLVIRDWVDGMYPRGDILPDEFAAGETAADKRFHFGIGPGCTEGDPETGFTGQAMPPVRMREVCEALDVGDGLADRRCCIESVCAGDYSSAMTCLAGLVENTL